MYPKVKLWDEKIIEPKLVIFIKNQFKYQFLVLFYDNLRVLNKKNKMGVNGLHLNN